MNKHDLRYSTVVIAAFICLMLADAQLASSNSSIYNTNMYGAKTGLNHALPSESEANEEVTKARQTGESKAESTAFRASFLGQDNPSRSRYPGWLGLFGLLGLLGLRGRSREKS